MSPHLWGVQCRRWELIEVYCKIQGLVSQRFLSLNSGLVARVKVTILQGYIISLMHDLSYLFSSMRIYRRHHTFHTGGYDICWHFMSFHDLWTEKRVIKNYMCAITTGKTNGAQGSLRHNVHISCCGYLAAENSSWSCFPESFPWFINQSLGGYRRSLAKLIFWHHVWLLGSGSKSSALSFSKPIKREVQVPEQCF